MFKIKPRHRELLAMIKGNGSKLALSMICMLIMAGSTAAAAYLIRPALDDVFINKNVQMLKLIPVALFFAYLLKSLAMFGQVFLMTYVGQDIVRQLRNRLYARIQDMPLSFFQKEQTGVLMSRVTNDVNIIQAMVSTAVTGSIRDIFTIIGLTGVIFYQIWGLAIFAFLILPIAFYPMIIFGRKVRHYSTGVQEAMANMSAFLHETIAGNKIVKAFGMEAYEKQRFRDKTAYLFRLWIKEAKVRSITSPLNQLLGGIGIAAIIGYGGFQVVKGVYTAGTFASFMAAVLLLYEPIKKLSNFNNALQQGLAATDRVYEIIERQSEITEDPEPVELPPGPHRVSFDRVAFTYGPKTVLQDINLNVDVGQIVALVGMSGGGKTSLVNLIPRFYDVAGGAIYIDGIDIRRFSIASLRCQIAIVTQEPILFNDSVRNNIAYGRTVASDEQIVEAAKAAYADEFIRKLPQGFDTNIGELGGQLSGGEKQRLCIARALIKDAPILILDEATSSLDSEAERLVQKALDNLMKSRTTFVIAHRLSTVANADRIIVLVAGQIVETGTHEQLLALGGEYGKLHRMQFENDQVSVN